MKAIDIGFSSPVLSASMHVPADWQGTAADLLRFCLSTDEYPKRPADWAMFSHSAALGQVQWGLHVVLAQDGWLTDSQKMAFGRVAAAEALERLRLQGEDIDAAATAARTAVTYYPPQNWKTPSEILEIGLTDHAAARAAAQGLYSGVWSARHNWGRWEIPISLENFAGALVDLFGSCDGSSLVVLAWRTYNEAAEELLRQLETEEGKP